MFPALVASTVPNHPEAPKGNQHEADEARDLPGPPGAQRPRLARARARGRPPLVL